MIRTLVWTVPWMVIGWFIGPLVQMSVIATAEWLRDRWGPQ